MEMEMMPGFFQCNSVFVQAILKWVASQNPVDFLRMIEAQYFRQIFENVCLVTIFWLPAFFISSMYLYIFVRLRSFAGQEISSERQNGIPSQSDRSPLSPRHSEGNGVSSAEFSVSVDPSNKSPRFRNGFRRERSAPALPPRMNLSQHQNRVPRWRRELRSGRKIFSQTGLLVLAYLICWFPYYLAASLPMNINVLQVLIALNSAVNPILYAFD